MADKLRTRGFRRLRADSGRDFIVRLETLGDVRHESFKRLAVQRDLGALDKLLEYQQHALTRVEVRGPAEPAAVVARRLTAPGISQSHYVHPATHTSSIPV